MGLLEKEGCVMKTLRLLKRDMAFGIFRRWYVFMIPLILGIAGSYECHSWIASINGSSYKGGETIADYVMYCMQGDPPMLSGAFMSWCNSLPSIYMLPESGMISPHTALISIVFSAAVLSAQAVYFPGLHTDCNIVEYHISLYGLTQINYLKLAHGNLPINIYPSRQNTLCRI